MILRSNGTKRKYLRAKLDSFHTLSRAMYCKQILKLLALIFALVLVVKLILGTIWVMQSGFALLHLVNVLDDAPSHYPLERKLEYALEYLWDPQILLAIRSIARLVVQMSTRVSLVQNSGRLSPLVIDVSSGAVISQIYNRMQEKCPGNGTSVVCEAISPVVIDIGANDGVLSSNSFNLIHLGFSAVLIEPFPDQIKLLRKVHGYELSQPNPKVQIMPYGVSDKDGSAEIYVLDNSGSSNSLLQPGRVGKDGRRKTSDAKSITVSTRTLRSIQMESGFPDNAAMLSIDAEGVSMMILDQLAPSSIRPGYVICETDGIAQRQKAMEMMEPLGYHLWRTAGRDLIFERRSFQWYY